MENQAGNPITPETNNTTNTETQQLNNPTNTQTSAPITNTSNTIVNPTIPIVEPKMDGYSKYAIASLVITLIPVVLFLYCYMTSGGSTNEGGAGAVW